MLVRRVEKDKGGRGLLRWGAPAGVLGAPAGALRRTRVNTGWPGAGLPF